MFDRLHGFDFISSQPTLPASNNCSLSLVIPSTSCGVLLAFRKNMIMVEVCGCQWQTKRRRSSYIPTASLFVQPSEHKSLSMKADMSVVCLRTRLQDAMLRWHLLSGGILSNFAFASIDFSSVYSTRRGPLAFASTRSTG